MRIALLALLAAAIALPALAAEAPRPAEPLSKTDTLRLPPAAVRDRVVDQLGAILVLPPERTAPGKATRALDRLWYATTPRATAVSGVCQSDLVTFLFEPTDPNAGLQPGDMPASVVGVQVQTGFRALRPPPAPGSGNPDFAYDKAACAELTDQALRFSFARADSVEAYSHAVRLLAQAQASAGTPGGAKLECTLLDPGGTPDCRKSLTAFNPASAGSVSRCTPKATPGATGGGCFRLDALTVIVEITYDSTGRITFVNVAEELVIADQRME